MLKLACLYKRSPRLSPAEFQARWLNEHGRTIAQLPGLRRAVQSHALLQGYAKGELLFDGIEELWFDGEAEAARALTSAGWADIRRCADGIFDPGRMVLLPVDVLVIKDGAIPPNAVKNIEFVTQRPGMDLIAFRRYWRDVHGPLASRIPPLRRYEQNHTSLAAYLAEGRPLYDGLAVTWFDSTADMKRGATTAEYAETRADEAAFLPDGHLPIIIAREHEIEVCTAG